MATRSLGVSKERTYNCPHCTRTYSRRASLQSHMQHIHFDSRSGIVHTKREDATKCPECGKHKRTKTDLYMHRLSHFNVDGFKCHQCGELHANYDSLQFHMNSRHKEPDKWFCPVCSDFKVFSKNASLLTHIASFHFCFSIEEVKRPSFICCHCSKHFSGKPALKRHKIKECKRRNMA